MLSKPKEKEQPQKYFQDKIAHVVEELKIQGSLLHWMESLKNGKCVLESPFKVLECFI